MGKLNLKKIRKLKENVDGDQSFKIAGESTGSDRREKRNIKKLQAHKEKDTLAKLAEFSKGVFIAKKKAPDTAPAAKAFEAEGVKSWTGEKSMAERLAMADDGEESEEEEDDADWASHSLVFEKTAEDRRREKASMESLATIDSRTGRKSGGDTRSFHERRLRPDQGKGGGGKGSDRW